MFNKADLPPRADPAEVEGCFKRVVRISARQEGFSDALRGAILDLIAAEKPDPDAALLANERQRAAAARAKASFSARAANSIFILFSTGTHLHLHLPLSFQKTERILHILLPVHKGKYSRHI